MLKTLLSSLLWKLLPSDPSRMSDSEPFGHLFLEQLDSQKNSPSVLGNASFGYTQTVGVTKLDVGDVDRAVEAAER
jgi:hypothetical protein